LAYHLGIMNSWGKNLPYSLTLQRSLFFNLPKKVVMFWTQSGRIKNKGSNLVSVHLIILLGVTSLICITAIVRFYYPGYKATLIIAWIFGFINFW